MEPNIRVKGFDGDWEERTLGEIYTERNERGNDSLQILTVSIHDGVSDGELDEEGLGKVVRRSEDKSTYKHVYEGDLVFNMMRAWQGAIGTVKNEGMVSPAYITAVPNKEVYPPFMDYALRRKESIAQINNLSYGVTDFRKRLYWDSFVKVKCSLPSVEEQRTIAGIFEQVDLLLEKHIQVYEQLRELKKYMLEKMFPADGEKVPEIRFAAFSGDWEERRLGECFNERTERSGDGQGELLSVTISEGVKRQAETEIRNAASADLSNYKKVYKGDLAYNSMRMWQGAEGASDYEGIVSPAYTVVVPREKMQSTFFERLFKKASMLKTFERFSQGLTSDTWNLKYPAFSSIPVCVPAIGEQRKISEYFSQLDSLITHHQRRHDTLLEFKAYLLQNMFPKEG